MLKSMIEKILTLAEPRPLELEGRPYTTAKVWPVETPTPDTMVVHTLTGIADYLNENPDGLDLDSAKVLIQVLSPHVVRVKSRLLAPFESRACYMDAKYEEPIFNFGQYMDIESFIIALQCKFRPCVMVEKILQLTGNISDDLITVYADDGTTQAVASKNAIGMKENRPVPNPVELTPYRTFIEAEQPPGRFVLRLKSGSGTANGRPAVALFDADGGAWQSQAILNIRDWLRKRVPDSVVIIA